MLPPEAAPEKATQLSRVSVAFSGRRVLDDAGLTLHPGEIHSLAGANGSGKSTLIKALAGIYPTQPGGILQHNGQTIDLASWTPDEARGHGLRFVHQEPAVFDSMTVAENLLIAGRPTAGGWTRIHWKALIADATRILSDFAIDVDPRTPVRMLRPAHRTMLAIARALHDAPASGAALILDEPTASLPQHEAEQVLHRVRALADNGASVALVSHRLSETLGAADRVTVLRDGRVVHTGLTDGVTHDDLIEFMTGSRPAPRVHAVSSERGPTRLRVAGVSAGPLHDIDVDVAAGELLGVAGLLGSGRTSLLRVIFGDLIPRSGSVELDGEHLTIDHPAHAVQQGIALVPEDRRRTALFPSFDVGLNVMSARPLTRWRGLALAHRFERASVRAEIERMTVRPSVPDVPVAVLSGGNQQKVVLARWLSISPRVLLLDEPTQGVDASARRLIHERVCAEASRGVAVVVVSSDLEELAELCTRVIVLDRGRITGALSGPDLTPQRLMAALALDGAAA
jgi:ribose transport system ATP-binding protein